MDIDYLNGHHLKAMLDSALLCLEDKYTAVAETAKAGSSSSIDRVAKAASRGALMGASLLEPIP